MKTLVALVAGALVVAGLALDTDSVFLLLASIVVLLAEIVGASVIALREARRRNQLVSVVLVGSAALAVSAIGVLAIFAGLRDDAPGLALLGIVVIVGVVTSVLAYGLSTADGPS